MKQESSEEDEEHQDEELHNDEDVEELVEKVEELAIPQEEEQVSNMFTSTEIFREKILYGQWNLNP